MISKRRPLHDAESAAHLRLAGTTSVSFGRLSRRMSGGDPAGYDSRVEDPNSFFLRLLAVALDLAVKQEFQAAEPVRVGERFVFRITCQVVRFARIGLAVE